MRHLAKKQQQHRREVFQEIGAVIRRAGTAFVVETDGGEMEAKRAASCLLEPAPGDMVIVAVTAADQAYVLAVLEREEGAPGRISLEGDLDIDLRHGRFRVAAEEGVGLTSAKDVSVVSSSVNVRAITGEVALQSFSFLSAVVRAEVEKAKLLAGSLDSVLDRLSQRVKRAYRVVEESDHLRAKRVDYAAKETMSLHGGNTLVTAEELVKLDGEQIHVG
jgi:hypothetical protein